MRHARWIAALAALAVVTAACGNDTNDPADDTTDATEAGATEEAADTEEAGDTEVAEETEAVDGDTVSLRWRTRPDNQAEIDVYQSVSDSIDEGWAEATLEYEPGGTETAAYQDSLRTEIAGGTAPDVFWIPGTDIADFANRGLILDLRETADAGDSYSGDDAYYEGPMELLTYNPESQTSGESLWGLPRDVSTFALYLNLDLIAEAGAPDPRELADNGEWNWDTFREVGEAVSGLGNEIYGFGMNNWWANPGIWINSAGGSFFNEDRTACALDSDEAILGLEYMTGLYQDQLAVPYGEDSQPPYEAGQVGMQLTGRWSTPAYRAIEDFEWDVVNIPEGPAGAVNWTFWGAYVVNANTEHPEQAFELITRLTDGETQGQIAELGANIPSRTDDPDTIDTFLTFTPPENNQAFIDGLNSSVPEGPLWEGDWPGFDTVMAPAIEGVVSGSQSLEDFQATICGQLDPTFRGGQRSPVAAHPRGFGRDTVASIGRPSLRLPRLLDAPRWLTLLTVWRVVHALAAGAALVLVLTDEAIAGPARIAGLSGSILLLLLDLGGFLGLLRRHSLGRSFSLAADYATFMAAVVALLQVNGVFVGLDALGATFGQGVPFFAVALLAWLLGGAVAKEGRHSTLTRPLHLVGVDAIGAGLIAVGLLPGLATFLARTARPTPLVILVVALVSAYLAWRTFQGDVALELRTSSTSQRTMDGLLFVSPNLIGFIAFFAGPLLFSLVVSLTEWDAFGTPTFVGLGNYANILSLNVQILDTGQSALAALPAGYFEWFTVGSVAVGARDVMFWTSIRNIFVFTLFALPLSTIPALLLATLLNSKAPGIKVFRAIYFIPSIAGVVAVALIWRQLFSATSGWLNYLISRFVAFWNGLPLVPEMTDPRLQWLSDADIALFSLVIVFSWMFIGYNAVLFLAGLQGIDQTLHEAAMLDGANRWQRFRNVTLPGLRPTTFFVIASTGILTLQLFGENVVLFPTTTPIGAGPENSTLTPVVYLYDQGFRRFSFGYASAVAWVLFILIFAFTLVQFRRQRERVEG